MKNSIKEFRSSALVGPDGIPGIFIKECCDRLIEPLHILFDNSVENCICASKWKDSYITPVYKNKINRSSVENYRPISIMTETAKILERIISDKLFTLRLDMISAFQHGCT